jgi:hypothetical protein
MSEVHTTAVEDEKVFKVLFFGFECFLTLFAKLDINNTWPFIGMYKILNEKKLVFGVSDLIPFLKVLQPLPRLFILYILVVLNYGRLLHGNDAIVFGHKVRKGLCGGGDVEGGKVFVEVLLV